MKQTHAKHLDRGYTLIEILVSISVIGVLMALTLVGLRSAREKGQSLQCLTHIRTMGDMVSLYAASNRDSFPSWAQSSGHYNANRERWVEYKSQMSHTFPDQRWLDFTNSATDAEHMYCPASQIRPMGWYEEDAGPDYWISASVFIKPQYLDKDLEFSVYSQQLGAQVQRLSSTRYPSSKIGVYENFVWHGWRGIYAVDGPPIVNLNKESSRLPGSVWFIDGHADQLYAKTANRGLLRYPVWVSRTYNTTPGGIHGRNF